MSNKENKKNKDVVNYEREVWKDIKGYEGLYQVSSFGRVKSLGRMTRRGVFIKGKIKKLKLDKSGYYLTYLTNHDGKRKDISVHRLVALTFKPNVENKPQVNHIDGIKINNHVANLEWATSQENVDHAWRTKLNDNMGINHYKARLNEDQVREIRELYKTEDFSLRELGEMFNVSKSAIDHIVNYRTWRHID